jgi:hypothetical protein
MTTTPNGEDAPPARSSIVDGKEEEDDDDSDKEGLSDVSGEEAEDSSDDNDEEDDNADHLYTHDHYDEENLPKYACRYCGIHDPACVAHCKWHRPRLT